jgi:hypothetical protein
VKKHLIARQFQFKAIDARVQVYSGRAAAATFVTAVGSGPRYAEPLLISVLSWPGLVRATPIVTLYFPIEIAGSPATTALV